MVSLHTTWCLSLISYFLLADHVAAVVTGLHKIDQSTRMVEFVTAERPAPDKLADQYTFDGSLNIGEGGFGAAFPATRKYDQRPSVVKQVQLRTDKQKIAAKNEIVWGSR